MTLDLMEAARTIGEVGKRSKSNRHLRTAIHVWRGGDYVAVMHPIVVASGLDMPLKIASELLDCEAVTLTVDAFDVRASYSMLATVAVDRKPGVKPGWFTQPYKIRNEQVEWLPLPDETEQDVLTDEGLAHIEEALDRPAMYPEGEDLAVLQKMPGYKPEEMRDCMDASLYLSLTAIGFMFNLDDFALVCDTGTPRAATLARFGLEHG